MAKNTDLADKVSVAVRNARAHVSRLVRAALEAVYPTVSDSGDKKVSCVRTFPGWRIIASAILTPSPQFVNGETVARDKSYRRIAEDAPNRAATDGPYSNPTFHTIVLTALKGRQGTYTTFDIALVDFLCASHLLHRNLQRYAKSEHDYVLLVALAEQHVGRHVGKLPGDAEGISAITIVLPPKDDPTRCVVVFHLIFCCRPNTTSVCS